MKRLIFLLLLINTILLTGCGESEEPVNVPVIDDTINCEEQPNHDSCNTVIDCLETPDDPTCTIDCLETPEDESCVIDCEITPEHQECLSQDQTYFENYTAKKFINASISDTNQEAMMTFIQDFQTEYLELLDGIGEPTGTDIDSSIIDKSLITDYFVTEEGTEHNYVSSFMFRIEDLISYLGPHSDYNEGENLIYNYYTYNVYYEDDLIYVDSTSTTYEPNRVTFIFGYIEDLLYMEIQTSFYHSETDTTSYEVKRYYENSYFEKAYYMDDDSRFRYLLIDYTNDTRYYYQMNDGLTSYQKSTSDMYYYVKKDRSIIDMDIYYKNEFGTYLQVNMPYGTCKLTYNALYVDGWDQYNKTSRILYFHNSQVASSLNTTFHDYSFYTKLAFKQSVSLRSDSDISLNEYGLSFDLITMDQILEDKAFVESDYDTVYTYLDDIDETQSLEEYIQARIFYD